MVVATAVAFHTRDALLTQQRLRWLPYAIWPIGLVLGGVVGGTCFSSGVCTTPNPRCTWDTFSLPEYIDSWVHAGGFCFTVLCIVVGSVLVFRTTSASERARERVAGRLSAFLIAFCVIWGLIIPSDLVRENEPQPPAHPWLNLVPFCPPFHSSRAVMDGTILGREIFGFGRSVFVVRHSSRETRPAQTHAQTLFTDPQPLPTGWQGVISGLLLSTTSARSVWRQSAALLYARYKWACCACFARTRNTNRDSNVNYVAFGPDEFEPSRSLPRANEAGERANLLTEKTREILGAIKTRVRGAVDRLRHARQGRARVG